MGCCVKPREEWRKHERVKITFWVLWGEEQIARNSNLKGQIKKLASLIQNMQRVLK